MAGIATRYGLDGPGFELRGRRDFMYLFIDGPEAHPTSCTMGTGFLLPAYSGGSVALTTHSLLAPRLRMGKAIGLHELTLSSCIGMLRRNLYLYHII